MDTISSEVSIRELRAQLADVLGRAGYGGQRIGITRNGKLAAVVIGVEDLEALEAFELAQDEASYRAAKAADDGTRISLEQLRADLDAQENPRPGGVPAPAGPADGADAGDGAAGADGADARRDR